jgi:ATP-dependent Lon protease
VSTRPLLPLRGVVVFPHGPMTMIIGRPRSLAAIEAAHRSADREILLVAQRFEENAHPVQSDVYRFGTIATIEDVTTLPDGNVKILFEGQRRARVVRFVENDRYFEVEVDGPATGTPPDEELVRTVKATFEQYAALAPLIPSDLKRAIGGIEDPDRLADALIAPLPMRLDDRQELLELVDVGARLERVHKAMLAEIASLQNGADQQAHRK